MERRWRGLAVEDWWTGILVEVDVEFEDVVVEMMGLLECAVARWGEAL